MEAFQNPSKRKIKSELKAHININITSNIKFVRPISGLSKLKFYVCKQSGTRYKKEHDSMQRLL
jgi:hypothetical protein